MVRYLTAGDVLAIPPAAAVAAIEAALRGGLDPAAGVPRSSTTVPAGELMLMPAVGDFAAGVKVVGIAPGNPARGLPRISATYVLFDGATLQPIAIMDGAALTMVRTPAVSLAAVRSFINDPVRAVVFGAGPQGLGHLATLSALFPLSSVDVVARRPLSTAALPPGARPLTAGSSDVDEALRVATVVVCATTARSPLFDSSLLDPHAVVIAVGSHEPDAREVDSALCARATVIVEDVDTALRECGDIIMAGLGAERLVPMREVVRAGLPNPAGPVLFKGSGMAWEDLVVATLVAESAGQRTTTA